MRHSDLRLCILLLACALKPQVPILLAQTTWDRYTPGTLASVIQQEEGMVREAIVRHPDSVEHRYISAWDFPTRARLIYMGRSRPLSPERRELLRLWGRALQKPADFIARFKKEHLFREDSLELWLAVQSVLERHLAAEAEPDRLILAFVLFVGGHYAGADITWLFLMNRFDAEGP